MIKMLKMKFIFLAMISLFVLLSVIVSGMNIINYGSIINEADETLSLLSKNKGNFPEPGKENENMLPHGMSKELPYESRYFSVTVNGNGEVVTTDTSKIASVNGDEAVRYALKIIEKDYYRGFVGMFRYMRYSETDGERIVFLDCGRKLDSFYTFLYVSIAMSLAGLTIIYFVILFFAGKILRPVTESYEKQKQFITDAGHEIKTPLTIINANIDILEMELGENESLSDIHQQTERLRSLTNDLVALARMEEAESSIPKIEFPISEVVSDTVYPFRAVAIRQCRNFEYDIQPMLTLKGNDRAIEQLVSILLDNAMKYSPSGGTVSLNMYKHSKNIYLTVFNTTEIELSQESLAHVFDRFYRTDASRNSETGGYGIGLSLAKAIVAAHNGKIQAWTQDGYSFRITASFPA